MPTNPQVTQEISGLNYCNLASPFPYRFVDREKRDVGILPAVPLSECKGMTTRMRYRRVAEISVRASGMPYDPTETFVVQERIFESEKLERELRRCMKLKSIDVIVVDLDVMQAAITAEMDVSKLFLPAFADQLRPLFYAKGVVSVLSGVVSNKAAKERAADFKLALFELGH